MKEIEKHEEYEKGVELYNQLAHHCATRDCNECVWSGFSDKCSIAHGMKAMIAALRVMEEGGGA